MENVKPNGSLRLFARSYSRSYPNMLCMVRRFPVVHFPSPLHFVSRKNEVSSQAVFHARFLHQCRAPRWVTLGRSCPGVNHRMRLCGGYNYDSTTVRRQFDCLSKVN